MPAVLVGADFYRGVLACAVSDFSVQCQGQLGGQRESWEQLLPQSCVSVRNKTNVT